MTNRPSQLQLEGFVEFLEQNPGIAKGILRTARGKIETKRRWEALAVTLNAVGGTIKSGQGWAKYWAEKKCALKKHAPQASASMSNTSKRHLQNVNINIILSNANGPPRTGLKRNPDPEKTPARNSTGFYLRYKQNNVVR